MPDRRVYAESCDNFDDDDQETKRIKYQKDALKKTILKKENEKEKDRRASRGLYVYCAILIAILLLAVFALTLGLSLGLQKSSKVLKPYGSLCSEASECIDNANMTCKNGVCDCVTDMFMKESACTPSYSFEHNCSLSIECTETSGLICLNSSCSCPNYTQSWQGNTCAAKKSVGASCLNSTDCQEYYSLECISSHCSCISTQYWNGTICVTYETFNATCSNTVLCSAYFGLSCQYAACQCLNTHYWNGSSCLSKKASGALCAGNEECQEYNLLECTSGSCTCPLTHYWTIAAPATCAMKKNYTETCVETYECDDNIGLTCVNATSLGNCPNLSVLNSCDCPTGQFYDNGVGGTNTCVSLRLNGNACLLDCQCSASLGLYCQTGTCQCLNTHYWTGSSCQLKLEYGATCTGILNECNNFRGLACPATIGLNVANCPTASTSLFCDCQNGQFYDNRTITASPSCTSLLLNNGSCDYTCQCSTSLGLSCQSGSCQCQSTHYWNGLTCVLKLEYGVACAGISNECNNARGLVCPSSIGINTANCPTASTTQFCDCTNGQFYDNRSGGSNTCVSLLLNGGSCNMTCQCSTSLGLSCQSGSCQCLSTHYWSGYCKLKLEYGVACTGISGECNNFRSLVCPSAVGVNVANCPSVSSTQFCDCQNGQFYDTRSGGLNTCALLLLNGETCNMTCQCSTTLGLSCQLGSCQCLGTHYWSGSQCQLKQEYGVPCTGIAGQCNNFRGLACPATIGVNVSNCPTTSSVRFCDCQSGQFYDNRTSTASPSCTALLLNNDPCAYTCQCSTLLGLSCQSGTCQCLSTHYWNSSICVLKIEYGISCTTGVVNQCNNVKGLACPSTIGLNVANCPISSSSSRFCDCQNGQFYDNRLSIGSNTCATLLLNGETCSTSCQCSSSVGLSCISNVCQCATNYYWLSTFCCSLTYHYSTSNGYGSGGSSSFSVLISDLERMIIYHGAYTYAIQFLYKNGTTTTYASTTNGDITASTTVNLINKRIIAANVRSGSIIDALQFQLQDITTGATTWTAQMGANGGGLSTIDKTTIASSALTYEIDRLVGTVDASTICTIELRSKHGYC